MFLGKHSQSKPPTVLPESYFPGEGGDTTGKKHTQRFHFTPDPDASYGPREVVCGIRPEDIRLDSADRDPGKPQALSI